MKVLIITREPFPNGMAATSRLSCFANGLNSAGIKCEVIIATRTEIHGQVIRNTSPIGQNYKYIGGTTRRAKNIFIRRLADYTDMIKTAKYVVNNTSESDVVLNYLREDPFNSWIIRSAKITGAKVVRDLCEYPFGTSVENGTIKEKREKYLDKNFKKFDGFVCISQALYDLAKKYKSPDAKLIKIPILIDAENCKTGRKTTLIRTSAPYIFHAGTLHEQKDGILGALEAFAVASKILTFPIRYILTGDLSQSPDKLEIERIIRNYGIEDRVVFTGFLSKEDLTKYQDNCTLMIINKLATQQNTYCFATKLGNYLLTQKPVITTTVGEASYYLKDGVSACIVEPGKVELLAEKIVELFVDPVTQKKIGKGGRKLALQEFSYRAHGVRLAEFLKLL